MIICQQMVFSKSKQSKPHFECHLNDANRCLVTVCWRAGIYNQSNDRFTEILRSKIQTNGWVAASYVFDWWKYSRTSHDSTLSKGYNHVGFRGLVKDGRKASGVAVTRIHRSSWRWWTCSYTWYEAVACCFNLISQRFDNDLCSLDLLGAFLLRLQVTGAGSVWLLLLVIEPWTI